MRTLGIDLASQQRTTAACMLNWQDGAAHVEVMEVGCDDERLIELSQDANAVGIDAPFGWPLLFLDLMRQQEGGEQATEAWNNARRDELRFRRTDFAVRRSLGRWPLSVSSDRIAIVAMRCAGLLSRLDVQDRSGAKPVIETYPAIALHQWGFASRGYKGTGDGAVLAALVADLRAAVPNLHLPPMASELRERSDHAFDALIAGLVARAHLLGRTERPSDADQAAARTEGWIAIPAADSLNCLSA